MSVTFGWWGFYNMIMSTYVDRRVADWPLMDSPDLTVYILVAYLLTLAILKVVMKSLQPFEMKAWLMFYNVVLILLSGYMFLEITRQIWLLGYSYHCNLIDHTEKGLGLAKVLYIFYLSKFLELTETPIMLLRRKDNQVSLLHVYHHVSITLLWWFGIKFIPGGEAFLGAWLNSWVHFWMYLYYLLAALGHQPFWKKYLTQMQMYQFGVNILYSFIALFLDQFNLSGCPYTEKERFAGVGMIIYMTSLLVLFMQFYQQAYKEQRQQRQAELAKKD